MTEIPLHHAWLLRAACRGMDPDLFHPRRGANDKVEEAKAVCRGCDVRSECLDLAVGEVIKVGVYGGLSARERRNMYGPEPISHGTQGGYRTHLRRGERACPACAHAARVARWEAKERAS